jgi:hypothetical protein
MTTLPREDLVAEAIAKDRADSATRIEQLERDVERLREALREIRDNAHSGDWTLPSSFANRARAALKDGGGG